MSDRKGKRIKKNSPWRDTWRRLKRNKLAMFGLYTLLFLFLLALFAPYISRYGYSEQNVNEILQSPSFHHLFGTDNFGRDIFSRVIYGGRYSLTIAIGCMLIASIGGTILGALAAFYKRLDNVIMRFVDVIMGIPSFFLAISIAAALGTGMRNLMLAVALTSLPSFARLVRATVMTVREKEYIEAAVASGASNLRLMFKYILPNSLAPVIVQFTLGSVNCIIWAASLSFIGLGIQPPSPEWGAMISAGRTYLRDYWFVSIMPGLAIILTTYSLNVLGDGLRDALDPRLK